jgi:phage antirepressor YoqD-like protein
METPLNNEGSVVVIEKSFNYYGTKISFNNKEGKTMINATEMAKTFGKTPKDWLRTNLAIDFINSLSAVRHISPTDLVVIAQGGINQGTWMHEDIALEFARWLDPVFAIWCNDRIKELMRHGATALNPEDLLNPDFIIRLASELKKEREEKEELRLQNETKNKQLELAQDTIKHQSVKVEYYDKVLDSQRTIATNLIAMDLGMSAQALNRKLHNLGIIYKCNGSWVLTAKYRSFGFAETKTFPYTDEFGNKKTSIHLYWTEKGRNFIFKTIPSIAAN